MFCRDRGISGFRYAERSIVLSLTQTPMQRAVAHLRLSCQKCNVKTSFFSHLESVPLFEEVWVQRTGLFQKRAEFVLKCSLFEKRGQILGHLSCSLLRRYSRTGPPLVLASLLIQGHPSEYKCVERSDFAHADRRSNSYLLWSTSVRNSTQESVLQWRSVVSPLGFLGIVSRFAQFLLN